MKRREVITIAVSVLIVLLLFAALKLSGNDAASPLTGQPFAETGDLLTDEATPSSRESKSPPLADSTGLELAGLSLPIGFAAEKRSAQALPDTKGEKYNLYSLKSKNPWWRKSNVSRGSFSLGRFRFGVNVIPAMLQTSKDAMLRSFRSAGPVKFKETTVPYAHGGLKGDRTFLQNIESRAGLPKDHVLIYSLYANNSIWFITFFYSDMEELTTFSEEFMSGVKLSAPSESAESSASTTK